MDSDLILAFGGSLGAIATAVLSFLAGRRRHSGRIVVSDAEQLWDEAKGIRDMLLANTRKAEEQRDQLMQLQQHEIGAFMSSATTALRAVAEKLDEVLEALHEMAQEADNNTATRPAPDGERRTDR